jgi:hypothetical protein
MTGWPAYLTDVQEAANGSAIIGLEGSRCGTLGEWGATRQEESIYALMIRDTPNAAGRGPFTYGGRPFIITRTLNDTLIAQSGKEGVILQTASRVFVAAHFVEGQLINNVAGRVARLVSQLTALGC